MAEQIILAFQKGGLWMWAILFFQVLSLVIIVERVWFLFLKRKLGHKAYSDTFSQQIIRGELPAVIQKAKEDIQKQPLALAIQSATQTALDCGGREEIQGKMEEALMEEHSALEQRTHFLVMLGNVGTLTGLLGTIMGMIKAFSAVTYANPAEKASLLSSGVSEAMNTTAYGLIMAIPALFMFAVLQNRANAIQEDMAEGAIKLFNLLSYNYQTLWEKKLKVAKSS